ncbi:GIY-YIG nuclease family protein [Aurantimonas sp. A3-2-R12]|uniref:GIY-YIG nuclease family protein n=1 Tax=Aurantimonas sp. A3-2-R12 TaxID=3114362 RepID=UPI002E1792AD|nr:GIY-YIG nuclease family protein [Aurantimonas sp. A3-2-R12]
MALNIAQLGVTVSNMEIGGHIFRHICDIEPVRNADGSVQLFAPQDRYAKKDAYPLNRYGAGPFCKFRIPGKLNASGVYVFVIGDAVHYIGECTDLSRRLNMGYGNISPKNCYKGGQETNCRVNTLVCQAAMAGQAIDLWFLETADYKIIESTLRAANRTAWNRV